MEAATADRRWALDRPTENSRLACLGDFVQLLAPVVPLAWMFRVGRWHGRLASIGNERARRAVRDNLAGLPPSMVSPSELDRMTSRFFENRYLGRLLIYLLRRLDTSRVDQLLPIDGLEHLHLAVGGSRGALLVLSHLNSVLGFAARDLLVDKGFDVRVAFPIDRKPFQRTRLRRFLDRVEGRLTPDGSRDFVAQFNIRPIVRALQGGSIVALTGDGWHSAGLTRVRFLGRDVYFTTGAAGIARTVGCAIVPLFIAGMAPDGLRIAIERPIWPDPGSDRDGDINRMVSDYARRLESHLRRSPLAWEHWMEWRALDRMASMAAEPVNDRYQL